MGTRLSIFFAVTDSAGPEFARATCLSEWYAILGTPVALQGGFVLDVGESIKCWRVVLEARRDDPLYPLFFGTVSTDAARADDEGGEPNGYFLDSVTVARVNAAFQKLEVKTLSEHYDGAYFGDLEEHLEATKAFLEEVVTRGHAVAALWG
jgi:hypothetical protein